MARNGTVTIEKMPMNKIKLGKNSRLEITDNEIEGLMQSIKEEGLLQPIGVIKKGTGYEICYGNRRFLACSKLGMRNMPVIIHQSTKESDIDIKNLTENVQRRNISLTETGRYIDLLEKEGLSRGEIAVRLGVGKPFVQAALMAFQNVPVEFRPHIEMNQGNTKGTKTKGTRGKISFTTASKIIAAGKQGKITREQEKALFTAAKSDSDFVSSRLPDYISAIATGEKNFVKAAPDVRMIYFKILMDSKEHEKLSQKWVIDGQFKTFSNFLVAVLEGKVSQHIKIKGLAK